MITPGPTGGGDIQTPHPDHSSRGNTSIARLGGDKSRLFALIIGIDNYTYENCRKLRGAAADARAITMHLRKAFRLPEDHIRLLIDHQATRQAIIQAFRDLRNDRRIRNGDPILIFFAGHGTELHAPRSWRIPGMIQLLLPYDYEPEQIPPIPDRTIGALISDISRKKGDNITVIFDCCFAAGGTRYDKEGYIARLAEDIPDNLVNASDLDEDILDNRHGEITGGFTGHDQSHILLAAAGESELAYEYKGRGLFTSAFLTVLQNRSIDNLTYAEVIDQMHLNSPSPQTPRCVGFNKERMLFNARQPARRQVSYRIQVRDMRTVNVAVGRAHGVSHGVVLTLCDESGQGLATVTIDQGAVIKSFQTTFTISEARSSLRNASRARLTCTGQVPLYLATSGNSYLILREALGRMVSRGREDANFSLVTDPNQAKLGLVMKNNHVVLKILDQRMKELGLTEHPYVATLNNLADVLKTASHFYWYLHHTKTRAGISHKLHVEFYKLTSDHDEDDDEDERDRAPVGRGLLRKNPSDNSDIIDFVVDPGEPYGIAITNNTECDLYLNAFLFNSSLRIVPYYIQSTLGNPEPPLKQNKTFTIGFGPSGLHPLKFWLSDNQELDVGYLKLFFATRPIDMTDVAQDSPLLPDLNMDPPQRRVGDAREGDLHRRANDANDIWFTKEIPIVQRKTPETGRRLRRGH